MFKQKAVVGNGYTHMCGLVLRRCLSEGCAFLRRAYVCVFQTNILSENNQKCRIFLKKLPHSSKELTRE